MNCHSEKVKKFGELGWGEKAIEWESSISPNIFIFIWFAEKFIWRINFSCILFDFVKSLLPCCCVNRRKKCFFKYLFIFILNVPSLRRLRISTAIPSEMREKKKTRVESGNSIASFIALGVTLNRIQSSANFAWRDLCVNDSLETLNDVKV